MNEERRLLMVGCGWLGRPYVKAAHQRGLRVSVLDARSVLSWDPDGAALGPGDTRRIVAGTDDEAWLAAAGDAIREDGPVAGVIGFSEPHVRAAALLAEELGLPGPGLRAAWTSRNKFLQRQLFARVGLDQPAYCLARDATQARQEARGRYPVVLKPLDGAGSEGVRVVAGPDELTSWYTERDHTEPFLVEQYLSGPEYSVEAIIAGGCVLFSNITQKTTTPPPFFVETEHRVPAGCPAAVRDNVVGLLEGVVGSLGMDAGLVHLEFRVEQARPFIMEVAVRMPGDLLMEVVECATGVNLFDAAVAVACGERPVLQTKERAACVWYPVTEPGVVAALEGLDEVARSDGVVCVDFDVAQGGLARELHSNEDRVGAVLVEADTISALDDRLRQVQQKMRIVISPPAGVAAP